MTVDKAETKFDKWAKASISDFFLQKSSFLQNGQVFCLDLLSLQLTCSTFKFFSLPNQILNGKRFGWKWKAGILGFAMSRFQSRYNCAIQWLKVRAGHREQSTVQSVSNSVSVQIPLCQLAELPTRQKLYKSDQVLIQVRFWIRELFRAQNFSI